MHAYLFLQAYRKNKIFGYNCYQKKNNMKKLPLVSIIVPCYNVEQYLSKCIDSILNQTYHNLEVWLVDDGSPDRCGEVCDEYAKTDSRINVIHKKNGGLSDARNVALDVARGEYIVFVDSDDYIAPNHIRGLYELLVKYQVDIAVNPPCVFVQGNMPHPCGDDKIYIFSGHEALQNMFYQKQIETSAWGKMYKRELFEGIRYPYGLYFEDNPTTYKLLLKSKRVVFQNCQSYFYLIRSNSIEGATFSKKKFDDSQKVIELLESDKNLQSFSKALHCKIVSFAFHILFQMPIGMKERSIFITKIKQYRSEIVFNKNAKGKTRLACLLSFLGFTFTQNLFKRITIRK